MISADEFLNNVQDTSGLMVSISPSTRLLFRWLSEVSDRREFWQGADDDQWDEIEALIALAMDEIETPYEGEGDSQVQVQLFNWVASANQNAGTLSAGVWNVYSASIASPNPVSLPAGLSVSGDGFLITEGVWVIEFDATVHQVNDAGCRIRFGTSNVLTGQMATEASDADNATGRVSAWIHNDFSSSPQTLFFEVRVESTRNNDGKFRSVLSLSQVYARARFMRLS